MFRLKGVIIRLFIEACCRYIKYTAHFGIPPKSLHLKIQVKLLQYYCHISFGGLQVACWPLVPKFAGSNAAEAVRFLRAKKSSARLPSEGK